MSNREVLLQTLPPEMRSQAEELYDELDEPGEDASTDPRDLVAEMHRRGILDSAGLRTSMLALEAGRRVEESGGAVPSGPMPPSILGPLGAGAMGEVLLAKDDLGRVVAVKRLLPGMASRKALTRRFFKEAQVTAQLDHPSIVPIHGLVDDGSGNLAYAMKLVRGRTLEDFIDEAATQWIEKGQADDEHTLQSRLERFLHVCDAIAYAHDKGVVHRDLKPENIMVGAFGQVIVMDWGIAKLLGRSEEPEPEPEPGVRTRSHQTRVGMVMGTPRYMSPEQAHGRNDVLDGRSDQYALGLILFELLTLQPAIAGDLELEDCLEWARRGKRVQPTVLHRNQPLPKQLLAIVDKATAVEPDDRYPGVADLAEDVRRHLRDEPVSAIADSAGDRVGRWINRNRGKVILMAVLGAVLAVAAVGGTGMFGVTALAAAQYRSEQQERRLQAVLEETNLHAMELDASFRDWNGQLNALAYTAEKAMAGNSSVRRVTWDKNAAPPDLKRSERYARAVDLNWPDLAAAGRQNREDLKRLVALGPQFRATLADSNGLTASGRPGAQRNAIEAGVPIVWAQLYTEDGFVATYPGMSRFRSDVPDFRLAPWFRDFEHDRSVVWRTPQIDDHGLGLIATATRTMADEMGNFLGVAVIRVSMQFVLDGPMHPETWMERTMLFDSEGLLLLSSEDEPSTATSFTRRTPEGPIAEAVRTGVSGSVHLSLESGGFQFTWAPVESTGWTFGTLVADGATPVASN